MIFANVDFRRGNSPEGGNYSCNLSGARTRRIITTLKILRVSLSCGSSNSSSSSVVVVAVMVAAAATVTAATAAVVVVV